MKRSFAMPAVALVAALTLFSVAAPAGAEDDPSPTDAAISWMDGELADNGGTLPGWLEGTVDWGLMGDFALARIAAGRGDEPATRDLAQRLVDNLGTYSTWDDQDDKPGVRTAGALAKVYLVALGAGVDTSDADGVDMETELRSLMQTGGDQAGRFSDRNPYGPDYSLGLSQAWAMMALAHTPEGVPGEALTFLAAQQCPAGGFRLVYEGTPGCEDDAEADPDSTALAIQVFLGVHRPADIEEVMGDAIDWLSARQQPDGSFGGGKYTEAPNANSTGVIGQTLRALGRTDEAEAAATWITELQLGENAAGTPAAGDVGAIAYDPAALSAALESGIADGGRDQWRRASAQGVLALGAGLLVDVVDPPGDGGGSTTTTTTTSSTTTTTSTTSSTTTTTSTPPSDSDDGGVVPQSGESPGGPAPVVAAETEAAGSADPASASAGGAPGAAASPARLASTGAETPPLLVIALVLVCAGSLAVGSAARIARRDGDSGGA